MVLIKQPCLEVIHSKTERNIVCVGAEEKQIVCKTVNENLVKWKWPTNVNTQKRVNELHKCFELTETDFPDS